MKFKYTGMSEFRDLDLVLNGVMNEKDILITGMVIEVSDSKKDLIKRMMINGNFEAIPNKPKVTHKSKKNKKKKDMEE